MPPTRHLIAVCEQRFAHMANYRAVEMSAMEGYARLLEKPGHSVRLITLSSSETNGTRLKAAQFILRMCKKEGIVPEEEAFDETVVHFSDIGDECKYY